MTHWIKSKYLKLWLNIFQNLAITYLNLYTRCTLAYTQCPPASTPVIMLFFVLLSCISIHWVPMALSCSETMLYGHVHGLPGLLLDYKSPEGWKGSASLLP
jgi:hypothetical protein